MLDDVPQASRGRPTPRQFCGAVRGWLDGSSELDAPLAAAAELLRHELADDEAGFVGGLTRCLAEPDDARRALGAYALLALWNGLVEGRPMATDEATRPG